MVDLEGLPYLGTMETKQGANRVGKGLIVSNDNPTSYCIIPTQPPGQETMSYVRRLLYSLGRCIMHAEPGRWENNGPPTLLYTLHFTVEDAKNSPFTPSISI